MIAKHGVELKLNTEARVDVLKAGGFDAVIVAAGVRPRTIPMLEKARAAKDPRVVAYDDLISGRVPAGERVAIIGAGGIGFDVAAFLASPRDRSISLDQKAFFENWGIDYAAKGGIDGVKPHPLSSGRMVYLLQRKNEKLGKRLGKTTGWAHRKQLIAQGTQMLQGVSYGELDSEGLWIERTVDEKVVKERLPVDQVVVCAGQESENRLFGELQAAGVRAFIIGGAKLAGELDAKRAIDDGVRLAAGLENLLQ